MIKYKKIKYKYQLVDNYETKIDIKCNVNHKYIKLTANGTLTILQGYAWDGASGPAIDTDNFMQGSLIHDALYQLIRDGLLDPYFREQSDIELRKACRKDGMSRIRSMCVYYAVRLFGNYATKKDKIYFAGV